MKQQTEILLQDLMERTKQNINAVQKFSTLSNEKLNFKTDNTSWSILECLEHLNLYGDFYIPEIKKRIASSNNAPNLEFKSGFLGNYFANTLLPKESLNKMKTFKVMNPAGSALNKTTIDRFLAQQEQLLELLNQVRKIDISKTKTAISISKLIKLKMGDTFKVVIYHNQRHVAQANKILGVTSPSQN